jgi:hypothetical protein
MTQTIIENQELNLWDVPREAEDDQVIVNHTFINCRINGPALMVVAGGSIALSRVYFTSNLDTLLWVIPEDRHTVVGGIGIRDCNFINCSFHLIGIAAWPPVAREIVNQVRGTIIPTEGIGYQEPIPIPDVFKDLDFPPL